MRLWYFFVLRKLILQTRMRSHTVGLDVWFFCLLPYFMCANSKGSAETARMRRLAWAFAGRLCDKKERRKKEPYHYDFIHDNMFPKGFLVSGVVFTHHHFINAPKIDYGDKVHRIRFRAEALLLSWRCQRRIRLHFYWFGNVDWDFRQLVFHLWNS